ncbi:hypothetical protein FQZ97_1232470 [compost metagenome]
MGIIPLVWVNISSSTTNSTGPLRSNHSPSEHPNATLAPKRNRRTRSPVWSLSQPQP